MAKRKKPALSELEQKVMMVVWKAGDVTAEQVRIALQKEAPMKGSTARTILRRLEEKGYAQHIVDGRTYVYSAKIAQPNIASQAVAGIIENFCGGSVEQLLVGMVDNEILTSSALKELAAKIAKVEAQEKKSADKKSKKGDK